MGRKTPVIVQCHSFLIHPPSQTLAYPFFTSSTGIVPSTHPAVNPQKHGLAAVANPTDTVCPTDTRTPSRPLPAARKMHEPEALASCFQPNLENVAGLLGDLSLSPFLPPSLPLFACANCAGSPFNTSQIVRKTKRKLRQAWCFLVSGGLPERVDLGPTEGDLASAM